jgi:hypothetical protein
MHHNYSKTGAELLCTNSQPNSKLIDPKAVRKLLLARREVLDQSEVMRVVEKRFIVRGCGHHITCIPRGFIISGIQSPPPLTLKTCLRALGEYVEDKRPRLREYLGNKKWQDAGTPRPTATELKSSSRRTQQQHRHKQPWPL